MVGVGAPTHRRDLGDLVKAAFELGKGLQRLRIGKWQELHQDDAGDVLGRIDPEIGVGEAGPGEAAGAPARRRSLGVDRWFRIQRVFLLRGDLIQNHSPGMY